MKKFIAHIVLIFFNPYSFDCIWHCITVEIVCMLVRGVGKVFFGVYQS